MNLMARTALGEHHRKDLMTRVHEMLDSVRSNDLLLVVVLGIPVAITLLLIVLLARGRRRRRTGFSGQRSEQTSASDDSAAKERPTDGSVDVRATTEALSIISTAFEQSSANRPALETDVSVATLLEPETPPAARYLELAKKHEAIGDELQRLEALRSAAGIAARDGPPAVHGLARIALAEAAYNSGDLTGACEQWQIARLAFQEAGQAAAHARVDKLMADNGCPTDWVLTDF